MIKEKIKELICNEYARYTVERYINKYGLNRFNEVKHIFAPIAADLIIQKCLNFQTLDEWEESKHPRKKNGQFGTGGTSSNSNKKSNTIAGVKQNKVMDFQQAMKGVNPNYNKGGNYTRNCAACNAVFIARMKGYNIEALPYKNNSEYIAFSAAPNIAFIDPKTGGHPNFTDTEAKSPKELNKWLNDNIEQDGMYMLSYYPYSDSNESHTIITFKNPKRVLMYYDPQNEQFYQNLPENIAYYGKGESKNNLEHKPPKVLRVDDKELDSQTFERFSKSAK